ncbi:hypothetical protein [Methylobacterium fujisawaense]|nr:hypothetical protein [Methylobacterium fujisawaense]
MRQEPIKTEVLVTTWQCHSCQGTGVLEVSTAGAAVSRVDRVVCATCSQAYDGAVFHANGIEAMPAQTEILKEHIRSSTAVKISQNIVAALLVLSAIACVILAPQGREVAASIVAAAVLFVGAGIAGIANFNIKLPLVNMAASTQTLPPPPKKRGAP